MAVLITGGASFIGSHLAERCRDAGEQVVIYDDLTRGRLANLERVLSSKGAAFIYGERICNSEAFGASVRNAVAGTPIKTIFHLIAPAAAHAHDERVWNTLAYDAMGTIGLIDFALQAGATMILASGANAGRGSAGHPEGSCSCFEDTRRFCEATLQSAMAHRGLDGRVVRFFDSYGPRMDDPTSVLPSIFVAARDRRPFPIDGLGTRVIAPTYVDDVVDGLLCAAEQRSLRHPLEFGAQEPTEVVEIARRLAAIAGTSFETIDAPDKREPVEPHLFPDLGSAEQVGWLARTTLDEGLRRTYNWYARDSALHV